MADPLSRPFSVRLPAEQLAHLETLAHLTRRSRNALIQRAVERYVAEELAFVAECEQAADEALAPGAVRIPHEAVRAWLQTWGSDDEAAAEAALLAQEHAPQAPTSPAGSG